MQKNLVSDMQKNLLTDLTFIQEANDSMIHIAKKESKVGSGE